MYVVNIYVYVLTLLNIIIYIATFYTLLDYSIYIIMFSIFVCTFKC